MNGSRFRHLIVTALLLCAASSVQGGGGSGPVPAGVAAPAKSGGVGRTARAAAVQVAVTYYQALAGQTDRDPHLSACGPTLPPWRQIALSRDLFHDQRGVRRCGQRARLVFSSGRSLNVVVNDTMHSRFRSRADVLVPVSAPARSFGVDRATLHFVP